MAHVTNEPTSHNLLKAAESLAPREFDKLAQGIAELQTRRNGHSLSSHEARLLRQINKGFSDSWWKRYHLLIDKRRAETLTRAEQRELLDLTDQLENREAKRMEALAKLAQLRQCSVTDLASKLHLSPKKDG
jgi:hypothetical protein